MSAGAYSIINIVGRHETLETVERDIADGRLGIARDRLHGLVLSFPADVSLRSRLGDVYFKLGYPIDAGRFWFFDEDQTDEKRTAIDLFVRSCNRDTAVILTRLKVRSNPEILSTSAAQQKVNELIEEGERRSARLEALKQPVPHEDPGSLKGILKMCGCSILFALAVILFVAKIGILTAWVKSLIGIP